MSMIGKTLGNFQCTALLGKGGMGEVYRAKDQKLGRDVAIKVLPEEFAKDADGVARFQREAKLLASLNHPNIAAIHGLEEANGTHFLVLELIEGDTLADRIKDGPIPVEESLKLALQIAEALEAAHEKGVIHRDLKPANIKVTPDGKWMAYTSNESGDSEIYVRPFPDVDKGRWQVSKEGGNSPLWSPDGKELFYRKDDEVIAVSVETKQTFKAVKSEILFRGNYVFVASADFNAWDINPDGKRFLLMKESTGDPTAGGTSRPRINIIANWFEELKERLPAR